MTLMKSTLVLFLALVLASCAIKDVPTLKADPAIHRTVTSLRPLKLRQLCQQLVPRRDRPFSSNHRIQNLIAL